MDPWESGWALTRGVRLRLARLVITAFVFIAVPGFAGITMEDWVAQNSGEKEELLCRREVGGEYFFIARAADKLRLGDRLDMTKSRALAIAWHFQDEKGKSLAVKGAPPVAIKDTYGRREGRVFAENVQYQTVDLKDSKRIVVEAHIKKCPTSECTLEGPTAEGEERYTIRLCDVPLKN